MSLRFLASNLVVARRTTSCRRRWAIAAANTITHNPGSSSVVRKRTITTKFGSGNKGIGKERALRKHKAIESVMGEKATTTADKAAPAPATGKTPYYASRKEEYLVEQYRQNRFRQALINACLSFFTVILAVQGVKNANACKKAQQEKERIEKIRDDERKLLLELLHDPDAFASPVTTQILNRINNNNITEPDDETSTTRRSTSSPPPSSWWWSRTKQSPSTTTITTTAEDNMNQNNDDNDMLLRDAVQRIIMNGLKERIGRIVMTQEERDKNDLNQLKQSSSVVSADDVVAATNNMATTTTNVTTVVGEDNGGIAQDDVVEGEESRTTTKATKKQVYAF